MLLSWERPENPPAIPEPARGKLSNPWDFYGYLKSGESKDTALQKAQLDFIRSSIEIELQGQKQQLDASAPTFFWATFQLNKRRLEVAHPAAELAARLILSGRNFKSKVS